MKILVINGSPKGERSETMKVTRAFLEGMGETYDYIDTMRVNVKPCLGCYACWFQTPVKCIQQDDMAGILEKLLAVYLEVSDYILAFHAGYVVDQSHCTFKINM